jgi:hypothetical protein
MIFLVCSVRGAWSVKKSERFNNSSKLTDSGISSFGVLVQQITFIPKAWAITATRLPIFP